MQAIQRYTLQTPPKADEVLILRFRAATEELKDGMVVFSGVDSDGKQSQWTAPQKFGGSNDWKSFEVSLLLDPKTAAVDICFRATGNGALLVDDVELKHWKPVSTD